MNYRRIVLLVELEHDSRAAAALVRRVAPNAELLLVVARLAAQRFAWFSSAAPAEQNEAAENALQRLREATHELAKSVEVSLVPDLNADDLGEFAKSAAVDLIAAEELHVTDLATVAQLRKRASTAVLWNERARVDRPLREVECLAMGGRAAAAVAAFLRDHADSSMHARVAPVPSPETSHDVDLLVVPRFPGALLPALARRGPVLILPPIEPVAPAMRRAIDVADAIDDDGTLRISVRYAAGVGRHDPIPDQQVAFVSKGAVIATAQTNDGVTEVSATDFADAFGVYRVVEQNEPEQEAMVIRPASQSLVLFDAAIEDDDLSRIAKAAKTRGIELLAVRMRPMRSCRSIRTRLLKAGLAPRVIDASAALDEGSALDVAPNLDSVRLARVAARMRAAAFPVIAIVHCGARTPAAFGFAAVQAREFEGAQLDLRVQPSKRRSLAQRLDDATGTHAIDGNRIEVEIDNAKARRWLLVGIAAAKERVHLQIYMAADDDVGKPVEAALAAAGARGVKVRVVVDSLHGFYGSFGFRNPILERLASRPGVELCVLDPITTAPSLEEVKQRDHRKLAVFDNAVALAGGRNLSHEYYAGFEEVRLTTSSPWREVPWLDAGARVEGPAVAALERSFLDAWTAAGGGAFEIVEPPRAGSTNLRVVTHHGLRDACTLDAYVALIDGAESHVYAVNGFPLILEIQHALLRALRRGVRVRTLFGNLTPTHSGQPFSGPWSSARIEATGLVHSRMDALVASGAEAYELAIPPQKAWAADIGVVHPHVHAKLVTVDGRLCAVGSANLDITAGYWENELMLIVDDPSIATAVEARITEFMAGSQRIDHDDPEWQKTARRREWMRHWPGVLSI